MPYLVDLSLLRGGNVCFSLHKNVCTFYHTNILCHALNARSWLFYTVFLESRLKTALIISTVVFLSHIKPRIQVLWPESCLMSACSWITHMHTLPHYPPVLAETSERVRECEWVNECVCVANCRETGRNSASVTQFFHIIVPDVSVCAGGHRWGFKPSLQKHCQVRTAEMGGRKRRTREREE